MRAGYLVLVAGTAGLLSQNALALEANEVFKRADPSIVVISVTDRDGNDLGFGSGVLIAPRDVVTNCHVVGDAAAIIVKHGGAQRSARLRFQDTARDLCQIQLDDGFPDGRPVSGLVRSGSLEVGQQVYAIGAPRGLDRTLSRGIVSALRDMKENVKLVQTDTAVTRGSSGGGLFDTDARLVGIITFGIEEGNLNFAIPTDWIQELAKRNVDLVARAESARPAGEEENPAISSPDAGASGLPRVGDRWKYRLIDGKQAAGTVVVEIVDARGKLLTERITKEGENGFIAERKVGADFNPVKFQQIVTVPGGFQLSEISPYASSDQGPKVGQRWPNIPVSLLLVWYGKKKFLMQARAVRQETVQVPAGTFNAMLVEADVKENLGSSVVTITCRYWYAPEMKRAVKMSLNIQYSVGAVNGTPEIYELVAFEPAK